MQEINHLVQILLTYHLNIMIGTKKLNVCQMNK